jgi:hypothetical protein
MLIPAAHSSSSLLLVLAAHSSCSFHVACEELNHNKKRLCSQPFVLVFTSIDAKDLPKCCKAHFSRIEVVHGPLSFEEH